jgi:hypothetical protein
LARDETEDLAAEKRVAEPEGRGENKPDAAAPGTTDAEKADAEKADAEKAGEEATCLP